LAYQNLIHNKFINLNPGVRVSLPGLATLQGRASMIYRLKANTAQRDKVGCNSGQDQITPEMKSGIVWGL
jgi:hypothetical protein